MPKNKSKSRISRILLQQFQNTYGGMLGDFPGNRDYLGKSLRLAGKSFFSLKIATYLDKAATTFSENTTCLEKHDLVRKKMFLITVFKQLRL